MLTHESPGRDTGAIADVRAGGLNGPILSRATDARPELTPAEVYAVIRGRLAVLVLTKRTDGSILTRPYVNMRAADRAVARARERGCAATAVLVRQDVAPLVGGESS